MRILVCCRASDEMSRATWLFRPGDQVGQPRASFRLVDGGWDPGTNYPDMFLARQEGRQPGARLLNDPNGVGK